MVEADTVRRLLEGIEQRLTRLEARRGITLAAYAADPDVQDIVERNLEVCIQGCIDLGLHVLADRPAPLPETNRGVFRGLVQAGLIEEELGARLESMAGFRNVLVHGYASVVPEKVHQALEELEDIRSYVRQITSALSNEEAS
ncbi:MAG TPA: DUF86 domain-containing protein [Longimicrobiales bacterium]|nr:DUF86 domain-containing protein [Longimicrobiales bacterium]